MLGWLAVAAAPILIHLWSRRRYREMSWAAMEYLLAALRQSRRRLRFEQWLLLLIRTLIVVLVVLAVAEPYLQQGDSGLHARRGQDASRARDRRLLLDGLPPGGQEPLRAGQGRRPADRPRKPPGRRVLARADERSGPGGGRHAGARARGVPAGDRRPGAAADHGRLAANARGDRRGARERPARAARAGARGGVLPDRSCAAWAGRPSSTPTAAAADGEARPATGPRGLAGGDRPGPAGRRESGRHRTADRQTDGHHRRGDRDSSRGQKLRPPSSKGAGRSNSLVDGRGVQRQQVDLAAGGDGLGRVFVSVRVAGRPRRRGPPAKRQLGHRQPPLAGPGRQTGDPRARASTVAIRASRSAARRATCGSRWPRATTTRAARWFAPTSCPKAPCWKPIWPDTTPSSCATWRNSPRAKPGR